MNILNAILTLNDCYKAGRKIIPKGVMVHSTGVAQTNAEVFINAWNRGGVEACVHAFIDLAGIHQTLPWDYRGWHAGGVANNTHIGFEICEDNLLDANYFATVYQEAIELTAYLCNTYNLDPLADGVVICHSEGYQRGIATNHADVMHWFPRFGKNMDIFRKDVQNSMAENKPLTPEQTQAGTDAIDILNAVHIVANPDDWKKTLDQPVPQWLFWVIMERIRVASIVEQGKGVNYE